MKVVKKMFKALAFMEFKRNYKGMILWSLGVSLMIFLIIVLYPLVKDIYSQLPPELAELMEQFGGLPENVLEYYATEVAMMLQIFGTIFAALLGYNMISNVEKEKTAEVLYTLPVSKLSFYLSKLLTLSVLISIFSLINYLVGYLGFISTGEAIDFGQYTVFSLLNLALYLHIGYLGFFLALLLSTQVKNMVALLVPLPLYIFTILSGLTDNEWLEKIKYLSPFTFADPIEILKTDFSFEYISFLIYSLLSIGLLIFGYYLYKKRQSVL